MRPSKYTIKPLLHRKTVLAAKRAVAEEYSIAAGDLDNRDDKTTSKAEPRMLCWFILRTATGCGLVDLGRQFGYRHYAVMLALRRCIVWLRVYPQIRQRYDRIATRFLELTK